MERAGTAAKELMERISGERCASCGVRVRMRNTDCCDVCSSRIKRKRDLTPTQIDRIVLGLVEPRYANAVIDDIDSGTRDLLRTRSQEQDVFFWGPPGVGKTYAMAAMIRSYVGDGYECMRSSFDEFCCRIRSNCFGPNPKESEMEATDQLKKVDMLFIDDLGLQSTPESDWVYRTFFLTLNKRQERLLPTIISSNKNPEQLKESLFDVRIISRLSTALVIEMKGKDKRKSEIAGKAKP